MKNFFIKALLKFLIPLIIIIILFNSNTFWGLLGLVVYFLYIILSNKITLFTTLASTNYAKGNLEKAFIWYEKAYNSGKMQPMQIASYAYIRLKAGYVDSAESLLSKCLQAKLSDDGSNQIKSIQALVLWKRQKLDEAIGILEEVMKQYKTTSIYGSLGFFLILKGDLEKALAFNLEAFDYNNSDKIIQDNLGQTYLALNELEKAKEIYDSLILTNPTFPEAYFNFGQLCEKLDQPDKAVELYKSALDAKFSYLSTLTKEQIQAKLSSIEYITIE